MKLLIVLGLILNIGHVLGSVKGNNFFNILLNYVLPTEIRDLSLDPAKVPGFLTEFGATVENLGDVTVRAKYFNGEVRGVSQVTTSSECEGPYDSYGSKNVNCTIAFNNITINYDGKLNYGNVPEVDIKIESTVGTTLLYLQVAQNPPFESFVKDVKFQIIGALTVKFSDLGPLNKFTKLLENGFKGHVQTEIFAFVSQKYREALDGAVSQIPLPL